MNSADDTVEVFLDNLKPNVRNRKTSDEGRWVEDSVDLLLTLRENTRALEKSKTGSSFIRGVVELIIMGRHIVYPLRVAVRSSVFVARNAAWMLHMGSAAEVRSKTTMMANAFLSGGPILILTGCVVFLFTKINIFSWVE